MNKKIGRPSLGTTKRVSLTLPEATWKAIDELIKEDNMKLSEFIRNTISLSGDILDKEADLYERGEIK